MSSPGWWLLVILARALDPSERPVVLGDLAESGEKFAGGLCGVVGLIVRRQAGLWTVWRPWLALLGVACLTGLQLSVLALRFNLDLGLQWSVFEKYRVHYGTGLTAQQDFVALGCLALALILWSWTSGLALGSLSGRAVWLTWSMFYVVVLNAAWPGFVLSRIQTHQFPPGFWRSVLLPLRFTAILVLVPAFHGAFQGVRRRAPAAPYGYAVAAVAVVFTALAVWTGSWYEHAREIWSGGVWRGNSHPTQVLPWLLLSWPAVWLFVMTYRRHPNGENT